MTNSTAMSWHEENQAYLVKALRIISDALERRGDAAPEKDSDAADENGALTDGSAAGSRTVVRGFRLVSFRTRCFAFVRGSRADAQFAQTVARAQRDAHLAFPTFGLALAVLPAAHWSALTPVAPLRYWRPIDVAAGETLAASRIRIDERVLHYLAGRALPGRSLGGAAAPDRCARRRAGLASGASRDDLALVIGRRRRAVAGDPNLRRR